MSPSRLPRVPPVVLAGFLGAWVWVGFPALIAATNLTYVYDELGRLVAVVDPAGETALYRYDAVGNLLSISRQSSALVSLLEFTPDSGPSGATVTIFGTGFSSTLSDNVVQFNGVPATLTSATATQIVTKVPAGATTGPISVRTPAGAATSTAAFTVAASKAPTITSVSPTIGTAGTAVTITGTAFDPTAANDRVAFSAALASIESVTPTKIATRVPSQTGSGKISVATPYGKAVSTQDFFIPPSPFTAADVGLTGRITIGGSSKGVTITTANTIGMILFDGTLGQRVNLGLTGVTMASMTVAILKPDGTTLAGPVTIGTGGGALDTPPLPVTGPYTILIDPVSTSTGSATLTLSAELTGALTIGGSAVTVTLSRPGQNARYTFSGTSGQQATVHVTSNTFTTLGCVTVALLDPGGLMLTSSSTCSSTVDLATQTVPGPGTDTVTIDPSGTNTGSLILSVTSP